MKDFRVSKPNGDLIGLLRLEEDVVPEINLLPESFTITPLWVKRLDINDVVAWQLTIVPDVPAVSIPDFTGPHSLMLMSGEVVNEDLIGAVFDTSKHPIYLHTVGGKVYNYENIIYTKRMSRA